MAPERDNSGQGALFGVRDLQTVHEAVKDSWRTISLFACSLGAYFSLVAFRDAAFRKCLFLSPVLDMERFLRNMMQWTNLTEDRLRFLENWLGEQDYQ